MAGPFLVIVIIAALAAFVAHNGFDWDEIWCATIFWAVCMLGGYLTYVQAITDMAKVTP